MKCHPIASAGRRRTTRRSVCSAMEAMNHTSKDNGGHFLAGRGGVLHTFWHAKSERCRCIKSFNPALGSRSFQMLLNEPNRPFRRLLTPSVCAGRVSQRVCYHWRTDFSWHKPSVFCCSPTSLLYAFLWPNGLRRLRGCSITGFRSAEWRWTYPMIKLF